ncbi:hypothetical protein HPP92_000890 [Vanilla planifolia]|uniref:Uncharacterized protein n=1 Tax=Vanilla planifolia TaxID=51239 RepID=A0A835RVB1_VANPL|nr:hypothetical protein HPP92_000890 [Vanilla planifolia]
MNLHEIKEASAIIELDINEEHLYLDKERHAHGQEKKHNKTPKFPSCNGSIPLICHLMFKAIVNIYDLELFDPNFRSTRKMGANNFVLLD